ncbi:MAG: arginine--tRNA ligase [Candidatus Woesearchaeota archaeon]|nr:arginine--tRNA ligase [Candidatus Woesearchaeota archaeon]
MFEDKVLTLLKQAGIVADKLEVPDSNFGDFALPCFQFARELKKAPQIIAQEFSIKLKPNAWVSKIVPQGAYVNFFLNKSKTNAYLLSFVLKQKNKYGANKFGKKKRVMIEFSSPNTNKPLHLGHVRNNCLGRSLSLLYKANGFKVIRANLVNDRGVHICKSVLAYQRWGDKTTPESQNTKSDLFVGNWYVKFCQEAEKNPELEKEAQLILQKWELGDKKVLALWKKMRTWCLDGFSQTYKNMGIEFDKYYYESKFWKAGKKVVEEGLAKGVFVKTDDGAIKVDLTGFNLPEKILMRNDGTTIYITQDLYLAMLRFAESHLNHLVYVVGSEQKLHFQQLFAILQLLGCSWAKDCYHFSYGMVNLPEGKMKSRTGQVVDADDIANELTQLAVDEIRKRHPELSEKEIESRAKSIGLGALTFFMIKVDPVKDIVYDPKESISFEGETGPYVQYAHARVCSILAKAEKLPKKVKVDLLVHPAEQTLLSLVSQFPQVVQDSCAQYDIHSLAQYLLKVATALNAWYAQCPVLTVEIELRNARLCLLIAVQHVLENGLGLLGIDALKEM